ncbi:uncharacterized protein LOC100900364 [Galendromus occidentalis]|uniref:Uncharacterized protein LOC100900364 n=1 Tax=Galendromus occidentalis TaxID=34638 RepID=A0AAJ6QY36_9ACAR|nr:uncharacterized protein LOC100900364 [Galendromus occidentalis]
MRRLALTVALVVGLMVALSEGDMHKKLIKIGLKALKKTPVIPLVFPLPLPKHLPHISLPHKSVWVSHGHISNREAEKLAWKLEKEYHKYVNLVQELDSKWPKENKW